MFNKITSFFTAAFFFIFFQVTAQLSFTVLHLQDFETKPYGYNLNIAGSGNNKWIINNVFSGQGTYSDVPSQKITTGSTGEIGSPDGYYMHINNISSSVKNANYNPVNASDRMATDSLGYCTLGYVRVVFQFWWLCQGSPADYGEVYYSINGGGSWTLATNTDGQTRYGNQPVWKFATIEDPAFLDQTDLRFAFRWVNDGVNTNDVLPFSVDDIMLVAYYDPANPIKIDSIMVTPLTVCHEDLENPLTISFRIFGATCPGIYQIIISDSTGSFINSTPLVYFSLPGTNPNYSYWYIDPSLIEIYIPTSIPLGCCYQFRIDRITPPEAIGITNNTLFKEVLCNDDYTVCRDTLCFKIIDCPDSIITDQFCASKDPFYDSSNVCNMTGLPTGQQEVCIYSLIDVPFFSYGAFNPGNNYVLELSDSSGSFANPTVIGGPMPDTRTWDPVLPYMPPPPGMISGQIPVVPPGCNYYVRVTSTDPVVNDTVFTNPYVNDTVFANPYDCDTIVDDTVFCDTIPGHSIPWGPFCIKECDIKTNDAQSISMCLTNTEGDCDTIHIEINSFDSSIVYDPSNEFMVQLISKKDMVHPTCMDIINTGVFGTWLDAASGYFIFCLPPLPNWLAIMGDMGTHYMRIVGTNSSDSCNLEGNLINLSVTGITGILPQLLISPLFIQCGDQYNNKISFYLQNPAPPSLGSVYLLSISGFYPIVWDLQVDGNPISLTFPALSGEYIVTIQEMSKDGKCLGPKPAEQKIVIDLLPDVTINGPEKLCAGDTVTFSANLEAATFYEWDLNWSSSNVGSILFYGNNEITLVINNVGSVDVSLTAQNECAQDNNSITLNVYSQSIAKAWPDTIVCLGDTISLYAKNDYLPVQNQYTWYLIDEKGFPSTIRDTNIVYGSDVFSQSIASNSIFIVKVNNGCPDYDTVFVKIISKPSLSAPPAAICIGDSVQIFTTLPGAVSYAWQPDIWMDDASIANPTVFPPKSVIYEVTVMYDARCDTLNATANITVNDLPVVSAGEDIEIFEGIGGTLNASGGVEYLWLPSTGLNVNNSPSPFANPDTTTTYYVSVTDANGCTSVDSVRVKVIPSDFEPGIPHGFTPNNDGVNDEFKVYDVVGKEGMAVSKFNFKIFDRWGEMIFETDDVKKGWNGTHYKSGKKMEVGVYIWLLTAESVKGEKFGPMSGNVSLLR